MDINIKTRFIRYIVFLVIIAYTSKYIRNFFAINEVYYTI